MAGRTNAQRQNMQNSMGMAMVMSMSMMHERNGADVLPAYVSGLRFCR